MKFTGWLEEVKDPKKFRTYETEVILMTVIMKNICSISSMQKLTDEFLPHYVTINEFLSRLDTAELEILRKRMICALLRRRKYEDAGFPGKYWLVIFDATGLFHFQERHCPHCLKKVMNKGMALSSVWGIRRGASRW